MSSSPTINFRPDGTLIIVSGPSGAGKTTLVNRICSYFGQLGSPLHFSVSHTTREPRGDEQDGVHYYFVSRERFNDMSEAGEFIEWAEVHGNLYGTSVREVASKTELCRDVVLDIDVQGARQISENSLLRPRSVSIFVFTPSFEELEARLRARNQNTEEQIHTRLAEAQREIELGISFYDYVIINDNVEVAADCLKAAVIAKKLKSSTAMENIRDRARRFRGGC